MKKKVIVIVGILLVISVVAFSIGNKGKALEVHTTKVVLGDITEYVEELSEVKLENQVNLFSSVSGRVTDIFVNLGDTVKPGDILLTVDNQSLLTQINILEENKIALLSQYNESNELSNKEIEKLELQVPILESKLREAEKVALNSKTLYEAGAISQQEYQLAKTKLEVEQSNLVSLNLDLELAKRAISGDRTKQFESQIRQLDVQIKELKDKLDEYTVRSTIGGTVISKSVEIGSFLQPGVPLVGIGDKGELYLESDILVGEIVNVKEGSIVEIYSRDLGIDGATGFIRKIHPQAISKISDLGIQQKRVKVEAILDDNLDKLRPGYNLDMKVIVSQKEDVLLIPKNAVFFLDGSNYVFVNENNKAIIREVELGMEAQRLVEILSGLQEGDEVIVSPSDKLSEGAIIKASEL